VLRQHSPEVGEGAEDEELTGSGEGGGIRIWSREKGKRRN